jgi:hypothetical protein
MRRTRHDTAISLVLVAVVIISLAFIWKTNHSASTTLCEKMGYQGFHLDFSGSYCYSWSEGKKVMTPLNSIGDQNSVR